MDMWCTIKLLEVVNGEYKTNANLELGCGKRIQTKWRAALIAYNGPITARVARPVSNDRPFPDYDNFAREKVIKFWKETEGCAKKNWSRKNRLKHIFYYVLDFQILILGTEKTTLSENAKKQKSIFFHLNWHFSWLRRIAGCDFLLVLWCRVTFVVSFP